jgi:hypothetical protein
MGRHRVVEARPGGWAREVAHRPPVSLGSLPESRVQARRQPHVDATYNINWLTSCGTMHDFDLAMAHRRVEPEDPHAGTLAIVVRDALGRPA